MSDWRPMDREPDALKAALLDYLRDRTGHVWTRGQIENCPLGVAQLVLPDASQISTDMSLNLEGQSTYEGRAALTFAITGQAADRHMGHVVNGKAIIDMETRCFLFLDITLSSFERSGRV